MAFDEVDLDRVLAVGHYGVVVKMASACVQCPERQRQFCAETLSALHCTDHPNKCLPLLLALETYEQHYGCEEDKSKVTPTVSSYTPNIVRTVGAVTSTSTSRVLS